MAGDLETLAAPRLNFRLGPTTASRLSRKQTLAGTSANKKHRRQESAKSTPQGQGGDGPLMAKPDARIEWMDTPS